MMHSTHRQQRFSTSFAVALAVVMLTASFAFAGSAGQSQQQIKASMAQKATVTIDKAIGTALQAHPGTAIKAELETEHGPVMWELEILAKDGTIHEVHVDGEHGKVVDLHAQGGQHKKTDSAIQAESSDEQNK